MAETRQSSSGLDFRLHPLVLINISDHHTRVRVNNIHGGGGSSSSSAGGGETVVLGILLGVQSGRVVDISNSFEIKYHLSEGGVQIDEPFLLKKQDQYKQVFSKLDVMGWYATGSELTELHRHINKQVSALNESPVVLLLDPTIDLTRKDLPVTLYESELHVTDGSAHPGFVRATYTLETSEAERIGVDQVAKILPSGTASGSEQLSAHLGSLHSAGKMLAGRIRVLQRLMEVVGNGQVPYPHALMRQVASLVHALPALSTADFKHDYSAEYNDTLLTIYLSAMTNGIHNVNELIDKLQVAYEGRATAATTGRRGRGGMM